MGASGLDYEYDKSVNMISLSIVRRNINIFSDVCFYEEGEGMARCYFYSCCVLCMVIKQ